VMILIHLNYRDNRPIYEQIKTGFIGLVSAGGLKPGEKMPSVRDLATQLAINPNTIQRAYKEMEAEGYIYSVPGKGSFVAETSDILKGHRLTLLIKFDDVVAELKSCGVNAQELIQRLEEGGDNI